MKDMMEFEGVLESSQGGGFYKVNIPENSTTVLATLSGKMKKNKIRVLPGDSIKVAVSIYDVKRGIIIRRHK
jgi:translation initiation factor IF-1